MRLFKNLINRFRADFLGICFFSEQIFQEFVYFHIAK